jgi:hypothetical protein
MCEAYHSCSAVGRIWENGKLYGSPDLERRKYTRLLARWVQEQVSVQEKRKRAICVVLLYVFRIEVFLVLFHPHFKYLTPFHN